MLNELSPTLSRAAVIALLQFCVSMPSEAEAREVLPYALVAAEHSNAITEPQYSDGIPVMNLGGYWWVIPDEKEVGV